MKRLLLLLTIMLTVSLSAKCQDTTKTQRIAVLNDNKDTLYVVSNMYGMMVGMWDDPRYDQERPTIVPVKSLEAYLRRRTY